jgi:hypothetical protein
VPPLFFGFQAYNRNEYVRYARIKDQERRQQEQQRRQQEQQQADAWKIEQERRAAQQAVWAAEKARKERLLK